MIILILIQKICLSIGDGANDVSMIEVWFYNLSLLFYYYSYFMFCDHFHWYILFYSTRWQILESE